MTIYLNKKFTKRNSECTQIVYAEVLNGGTLVPGEWEDCGEHMPAKLATLPHCQHIHTVAGIRYYGYL